MCCEQISAQSGLWDQTTVSNSSGNRVEEYASGVCFLQRAANALC